MPANAIWRGGCDGGHWIELVSVKEPLYRFRVYRMWDGTLEMDANYHFVEGKTVLSQQNWQEIIGYYYDRPDSLTSISVITIENDEKVFYSLHSIYPAFGGDDWEIIKEKYNLHHIDTLDNINL